MLAATSGEEPCRCLDEPGRLGASLCDIDPESSSEVSENRTCRFRVDDEGKRLIVLGPNRRKTEAGPGPTSSATNSGPKPR